MGLLEGKVAIVTGAGGGLGRAYAKLFAKEGASVVVNDFGGSRDGTSGGASPMAQQVVEEIIADGGKAVANGADVSTMEGGQSIFKSAIDSFGKVDILVNNAGILRDKSFAKMSLDDFRLVLDVHLIGAVICTKGVWDIMRGQHYGRVIMTTSSTGLYGNFGQANYGAAKMALVGLMQTLAIEGEKYDIRVNCLAPSAATQMTRGVLPEASLKLLAPALVSPGLLLLAGTDAPTRTILCAGAGHFACANVTLSRGHYIGAAKGAGEEVLAHWEQISDRTDDTVPAFGFVQAERELASAGLPASVAIVQR